MTGFLAYEKRYETKYAKFGNGRPMTAPTGAARTRNKFELLSKVGLEVSLQRHEALYISVPLVGRLLMERKIDNLWTRKRTIFDLGTGTILYRHSNIFIICIKASIYY